MSIPWIDRPAVDQGPMILPQEMYDEIMSLPDGADLSEYFEPEDSSWVIRSVTLKRPETGSPVLASEVEMTFVAGPPAGAVPGAED